MANNSTNTPDSKAQPRPGEQEIAIFTRGTNSRFPAASKTFEYVLESIETGRNRLKAVTAGYRAKLKAAGDAAAVKAVKATKSSLFPAAAFGWSGKYDGDREEHGRRRASTAQHLTPFTTYDLDGVDDPEAVVEAARTIDGVVAAGRSVSGSGVWIVLLWDRPAADAEDYTERWWNGAARLKAEGRKVEHQGGGDTAPSSCVSLRFLGHDPDVLYRPDAAPLCADGQLDVDAARRLAGHEPKKRASSSGKRSRKRVLGPAGVKALEERCARLAACTRDSGQAVHEQVLDTTRWAYGAGVEEGDEHYAMIRKAAAAAGVSDDEFARAWDGAKQFGRDGAGAEGKPGKPGKPAAKIDPLGLILADVHLAKEFVKRRGEDLRWRAQSDTWCFWTGGQEWVEQIGDPITAELMDLGADLVHKMTGKGPVPAPERGGRASFARSAAAWVRERPRIKTADGDWDTAPKPSDNLLGLPGGKVVEVRGEDLVIRPRERADLISKSTAVAPCADGDWLTDDEGNPTRWGRHVHTLFDDQATAAQFHRLCGAGLIGRAKESFALLVGPGGTGKTVTCDAILRAVGTYGKSIPEEAVWGRLLGHPTSRTEFHGRRFAVVSEGPPEVDLDTSFVKRLTGGEQIDARRMRENTISFRFDGLLMLYGNHTPSMRSDSGIKRRLRVFQFLKPRYDGKPDKAWLDGVDLGHVLGWLVDGARDFLKHGLGDAPQVDAETEDLLADSDSLAQFIREELEVDGVTVHYARELHAAYEAWRNNEPDAPAYGQTQLRKRLAEADGRIRQHPKGVRGARVKGARIINPNFGQDL